MARDTDVAWHAALLRITLAEENDLTTLERLAAGVAEAAADGKTARMGAFPAYCAA